MIVMPSTYPFPSIEPEPWEESAVCRSVGRDVFFIKTPTAYKTAKAICQTCPVIGICLASALANGDEFGVFGGTTPSERQRIVANRREQDYVTGCSVGDCSRKHHGRGLCKWHYNRMVRPKYVAS